MVTWILIIFLSIVIATGIGFMIVHFRFKNDESYSGAPRLVALVTSATGVVGMLLLFVVTTWVSNDVGKAQVQVDSVNRQIVGQPILTPMGGPFLKSPFVDLIEFDLRQQEIIYAGAPGKAPAWVGERNLDGAEITVQVGGATSNIDTTINYQLLPTKVVEIYSQYGSQSAFETQVVKDQAMSTIRQVPSGFTTSEFRGSRKGEAELKMTTDIQSRLKGYISGVAVSIQEIRYPEDIERQLRAVENAKLENETAKANQERSKTENATLIARAKAEAEANHELSKSLTPEVLEARRIAALEKGEVIYVPYGSTILAK